jgi:hypothetical protein
MLEHAHLLTVQLMPQNFAKLERLLHALCCCMCSTARRDACCVCQVQAFRHVPNSKFAYRWASLLP